MNLLKAIVYARACVYREAYEAENKSGGDSRVIASCLVGVFDAPLILAMLLALDSLFFDGIFIRNGFSSNITSAFSISFTVLVCSLEYLYYEVLKIGLSDKTSPPKNRAIGISYAVLSLVVGSFLVYWMW
ncbi:MAG: hypothetical protein U5M23_01030 [Marinagarivorans sp.]|nr:hypothetical protein [Marinagarivorans sp.]